MFQSMLGWCTEISPMGFDDVPANSNPGSQLVPAAMCGMLGK